MGKEGMSQSGGEDPCKDRSIEDTRNKMHLILFHA